MSRPEPDARARSAKVIQSWSVTCRWVGIVDGQFRIMHQRLNQGEGHRPVAIVERGLVQRRQDPRERVLVAHGEFLSYWPTISAILHYSTRLIVVINQGWGIFR